jgi:hypothetical protein
MSSGAGTSEATLARLKSEVTSFKKAYEKLKDFLTGAEYDVSDVRGLLHELKERMSYICALMVMRVAEVGRVSEFEPILRAFRSMMDELMMSIDIALVMIEWYPKEKLRLAVQTSLALSKVKIEDFKAFLELLAS